MKGGGFHPGKNITDIFKSITDDNQSWSHRFLFASLFCSVLAAICIITIILIPVGMIVACVGSILGFLSFIFLIFGDSPLRKGG